jgi:hypothetical protein
MKNILNTAFSMSFSEVPRVSKLTPKPHAVLWFGILGHLVIHIRFACKRKNNQKECEWRPFPCANADNGCDFVAPRKRLEEHENKCESRPVLCPDGSCDEMIPLNKLEQHLLLNRELVGPCQSTGQYGQHKPSLFEKRCCLGDEERNSSENTHSHISWKVSICKYETTTFFLMFDMVDGLFFTWLYVAAGEGEKFTK